jgi:hypothetical protein
VAPAFLNNMEKLLTDNGGKRFVGNEVNNAIVNLGIASANHSQPRKEIFHISSSQFILAYLDDYAII